MLRFKVPTTRLFSSTPTTASGGKLVSKRIELGFKLRAVLADKFASLPLLEKRTNTELVVDARGVTIKGEEDAVEKLVQKLQPTFPVSDDVGRTTAETQAKTNDVSKLLSTILGEPTRLKLDEYRFNSILPRGGEFSNESSISPKMLWMHRSAVNNALLIWSESQNDAEMMVNRIKEWTPILAHYEHQENPTRSVEKIHPSFRWYEKNSLNDSTDTIINVQFPQAKIWATKQANAEKAAELLTKPYQPSGGSSTVSEMVFQSSDPVMFECIRKATESIIHPDDHLVKAFVDRGNSQVKFSLTGVQPRQLASALQQEISKQFASTFGNSGANCTFHGPLTTEVLQKGLEELKRNPSEWEGVSAYPFENVGGLSKVCLTGKDLAKVTSAKWLFPCEGTIQLPRLREICGEPAKKLLQGTRFNEQFIRMLEINCLQWKQTKKLTHWGFDYFTCQVKSMDEILEIQKDWSELRLQVVHGLDLKNLPESTAIPSTKDVEIPANSGAVVVEATNSLTMAPNQLSDKFGISFWHLKPKESVVFGKQENISKFLAVVQPQEQQTKRKSQKASSSATKPATKGKTGALESSSLIGETVPSVKKEKLGPSPPAQSSPEASNKDVPAKVTRITVPPIAPAQPTSASVITTPAKVTRITAPIMEANGEEISNIKQSTNEKKREKLGASAPSIPSTLDGSQMSHSIDVPSKLGGKVVGRHGLVLKGIEERTKTRIRLEDDDGNSSKRKVLITGLNQEAIDKAVQEIQSIIETAALDGQRGAAAVSRRRGKFQQQGGESQDEQRRPQAKPNAKIPLFSPKYREKIYETYQTDPSKWTMLELSKEFRLPEVHIQAILTIMKHREEYLNKYKDDEEMINPIMEQLVVKKCGEHVPQMKTCERPICKNHYRFLPAENEVSAEDEQEQTEEAKHFHSMEEELEYRRKRYEEKSKNKKVTDKPILSNPVLQVKKSNGFEVVFQS